MSISRSQAQLDAALLRAISNNGKTNLNTIKALVKQGANVNGSGTPNLLSPLSLAIKKGSHQVAEFLLKQGAQVVDYDWNLVHSYVDIEMAIILLSNKAIPKTIKKENSVSSLFYFSTSQLTPDQKANKTFFYTLINISIYLSTVEGKKDEAAVALKKAIYNEATEESLKKYQENFKVKPLKSIYECWLSFKDTSSYKEWCYKRKLSNAKKIIGHMIATNHFSNSSKDFLKDEALKIAAGQLERSLTEDEEKIIETEINNSIVKAKLQLVALGEQKANKRSYLSLLPSEIHSHIAKSMINEFPDNEQNKDRVISILFEIGKRNGEENEKQKTDAIIDVIRKAVKIQVENQENTIVFDDINIARKLCEVVADKGWPSRRVKAKINFIGKGTYEVRLTTNELESISQLTSSSKNTADEGPSCSY